MKIAILTTGGTIEKTYNETDGSLANVRSVLDEILDGLRLHDLDINHLRVMSKDSLHMTDADREAILEAVRGVIAFHEAIVVVHGTDTLAQTGEHLHRGLGDGLDRPVILTGAMRPYEFRDTDAFQNVTEALLACRLVQPGVYAAMHNQVLRFPGVVKDKQRRTFTRETESPRAKSQTAADAT